ncbi:MAG: hypothetical protein AAF645_05695 [Myxococcota bacterium]
MSNKIECEQRLLRSTRNSLIAMIVLPIVIGLVAFAMTVWNDFSNHGIDGALQALGSNSGLNVLLVGVFAFVPLIPLTKVWLKERANAASRLPIVRGGEESAGTLTRVYHRQEKDGHSIVYIADAEVELSGGERMAVSHESMTPSKKLQVGDPCTVFRLGDRAVVLTHTNVLETR